MANAIAKRSGRTYSRGLHKIEPDELKNVPVVDPNDLSAREVLTLSRKFRDLCEASRNDTMDVEAAVQELDEKVMDVISRKKRMLGPSRRSTD